MYKIEMFLVERITQENSFTTYTHPLEISVAKVSEGVYKCMSISRTMNKRHAWREIQATSVEDAVEQMAEVAMGSGSYYSLK